MNANIPLLARRLRKPKTEIERLWRRAKQVQSTEGDKSNYLGAWWTALNLLEVSERDLRRREPLQISDMVSYGKLSGVVRAYDPELAYIDTVRGQVGLPIVLLYLAE